MIMLETWSEITTRNLGQMWDGFLSFIPSLIAALVVLIVGWLLSSFLGRIIAEILKKLRFNKIFERAGWKEAFQKAELKVDPAEFIGAIFKWILVIVFLLISVEILGFDEITVLIGKLVAWLPNLIVSVAIFVVAVILTDILEKLVKVSVRKMGVGYADFLGALVRWSIYIFAVLAILAQLKVPVAETILNGLVATFVLAFGLSFGLGGKDAAARLIEDVKRKMSEK